MTKTLTIAIQDIEKVDSLTISGSLNEKQFNETIILSIGQTKMAVNSQDLATALKEVVDFQMNVRQGTFLIPKDSPDTGLVLNGL